MANGIIINQRRRDKAEIPEGAVYLPEFAGASGTGSMLLQYTSDGSMLSGGSATVYKWADLCPGGYAMLTEDFMNSGLDVRDYNDDTMPIALADYINDFEIYGITRELPDLFENLGIGFYLVLPQTVPDGYNMVDPFIVTIPDSDGYNDLGIAIPVHAGGILPPIGP